MIKADFTGAKLKVIKSLNPTLIGICGMVAKETMRTFVIVENNKEKNEKENK